MRAYRANGELDSESVHSTEASRDVEVMAYKARMARGEVAYIEVTNSATPQRTERIY